MMIEIILGCVVLVALLGIIIIIYHNKFRISIVKMEEAENNIDLFLQKKLELLKRAKPIVEKELKIDKHITFHVARHTFATLLVQDGVSIYDISKYLGHKSINMTQRYLKYDQSMAETAAKKITTFNSL